MAPGVYTRGRRSHQTAAAGTPYKALDQLQSQPRAAVTLGTALPSTIAPTNQIDYRIRSGYD